MNKELNDRIDFLGVIKEIVLEKGPALEACIEKSYYDNPWFTPENSWQALDNIASRFLDPENLRNWVSPYNFGEKSRRVGIVMAGNLPLVGFHDFLSVFIAGYTPVIKLSSKDQHLLPYLLREAKTRVSDISVQSFEFVDKLKDIDAVIATGSDNSARYFDYYFGRYPNIIRKNRTSIAVLTGEESTVQLQKLGSDIFSYFGKGCRSVSALRIPINFRLDRLFEAWVGFDKLTDHSKYRNNFEYNYSVYMLNNESFLTNNVLMLKEDSSYHPPLSVLYYNRYESEADLLSEINGNSDLIQCVVSKDPVGGIEHVTFGEAQRPGLTSYADNVDTLKFLESLT